MNISSISGQNQTSKSAYQISKDNFNQYMKDNSQIDKPEKASVFLKEPSKGSLIDFNA